MRILLLLLSRYVHNKFFEINLRINFKEELSYCMILFMRPRLVKVLSIVPWVILLWNSFMSSSSTTIVISSIILRLSTLSSIEAHEEEKIARGFSPGLSPLLTLYRIPQNLRERESNNSLASLLSPIQPQKPSFHATNCQTKIEYSWTKLVQCQRLKFLFIILYM